MSLRRLGPLSLTVALLLVTIYIFRERIAADRLAAHLRSADPIWLAISVPFFLASFAGAIYRNKFIIDRATGESISFRYLFLASNFSYALGYVAPISIAAEAIRVGLIKKHMALTYTKSLRLVAIDKVLGFSGMALFALLFAPWNLLLGIAPAVIAVECLLLLGFFLVLPIAILSGSVLILRVPVPGLSALSAALLDDWKFVVDNFSRPRDLAVLLLCSFLAVAGFGAGCVMVAGAMQVDRLATVFAIAPTIVLVQNIPLFYAGFGAREAALLLILKEASAADPNRVLGFSLLVGMMLFASAIPASIAFALRGSR
jgi:hypothetical protein